MFLSIIKKYVIILSFFLFLFSNQIFPQVNSNVNFLPLHVGNTWQYAVKDKPLGDETTHHRYVSVNVVGQDVLDGKTYYTLTNSEMYCLHYIRIDSATSAVYTYKDGADCMIDSLSITKDDNGFSNECYGTVFCIADTNQMFFGNSKRVKKFKFVPPITYTYKGYTNYEYVYGIGKNYSHAVYPAPDGFISGFRIDSLVYAKIDGEEYGTYVPENKNSDVEFYPLHIGDTWQYLVEYKYQDSSKDSTYYASVSVWGIDTLEDGKEYYSIINSEFDCVKHIRIDSIDATIWNASTMLDSLSMQVNDEMSLVNSQNPKMCLSDSIETLFDKSVRVKTFAPINIPLSQSSATGMGVKEVYKYAWGLGEIYSETSDIGIEASRIARTLNYAKIDGVEYGNRTISEDRKISLSQSTLYLFRNENNLNFADTTWLINKSQEVLMVDSVINNRGYSYRLSVLFPDSSSQIFSLMQNYIDTVNFNVSSYDSVRIILSNPDLCPVCSVGGDIKNFTDSLQFFTNSKTNSVLLLSIIGDGTLDAENIKSEEFNFSLSQNYPNPFNPSTIIVYSIPASATNTSIANVVLKVYDILGREIATLVNKEQKAGNYEVKFDASTSSAASKLTSGIYFYTIQVTNGATTNYFSSKKMLLIK